MSVRTANGVKSAKLKLARAQKHLNAIKRCIEKYSASRPHKISGKGTDKKKLNVSKGPPQEIAILAGEMLYQIRSALDHLAFEIVKQNSNIDVIDPKWREHCQFPLRTSLSLGRAAPLSKVEFRRDLPGISDDAFAVIEQMQPYYRSKDVHGFLELLAILSNIDKHRRLSLIRPRVRQRQYMKLSGGRVSTGWQLFDRGAVVDSARPSSSVDKPIYVNRRYETIVAFNEREHLGDATAIPLEHLLFLILYHVEVFVVPPLEEIIRNEPSKVK